MQVVAIVYIPLLTNVLAMDVETLRITALSSLFDLISAFRAPDWAAFPADLTMPSGK